MLRTFAMATPSPADTRPRWPIGLILFGVGLGVVALALNGPSRCDDATLFPLLVAAIILGILSVRLPGDAVSLLPGVLLPTWLSCGADVTTVAAFVGGVAGSGLLGGLLSAAVGATGALAGVLGGTLAARLATGPTSALAGGLVLDPGAAAFAEQLLIGTLFMAGYWAGEGGTMRLAARASRADVRGRVPRASLVANLLLVFPGVVVADVLATRGPLLAGLLLALLIAALVLIGLYTAAETARHGAAGDRARLQSIVAYAPDGIFAVGPDLRLEWVNGTTGRLTGWSPADATGRACDEVVRLRGRDGGALDHGDAFARAASSGTAVHAPATLRDRHGAEHRVVVSYTAVPGPTGGFDIGVGAVREVADEETEGQSARGADLGHELRSPLTAILGYAQMLKNPPAGFDDPERRSEFAGRIVSSGDYMLRLVNNVLDLRRMESGAEPLQPTPLQLDVLLRTTLSMMTPRASEKDISLSLDVEPDLPALRSDELLVRRVLDNLISNAVKYTPAGGSVRVTAGREGDGIAVAVADTGIGLTEEEQARLFERFFRSGRPEARQERGTGLGLSLVREAARRLGGEIRVTSAVGVGSTFTLWLPRTPPAAGAGDVSPLRRQ